MYVIPLKLKQFREAKGLTQMQIAEMLNIEQTTYSKIELAKSQLRFEMAIQIAIIIKKDLSEFSNMPKIENTVNNGCVPTANSKGDNSRIGIPDTIIGKIEELLVLIKQYFKVTTLK